MKAKKPKKVISIMPAVTGMPVSNEAKIVELQTVQRTAGWMIIRNVLLENIQYIEQAILDKKDPESGAQLKDEDIDRLRYRRSVTKELLETPAKLIKNLMKKESLLPEFDPYFSNAEEMRKQDEERI